MGASYSAPGKLILLGDYAVLEGGTAIVAAVDRRASGRMAGEGDPAPQAGPSAVVEAVARAAARRRVGRPELAGAIRIDTSSFSDDGGRKLGLGSSAAAAIVASALILSSGGEEALSLAVEGHRDAFGGEGSGVDVAACYHGGVIACRRQPGPVAPLASRVRDLNLFVLDTGRSASTADLVRACRASSEWKAHAEVLRSLAEEGLRAWESQSAQALLSVVARAGRAMKSLGRSAGVRVVTEELEAIMRIAGELGGAAKPSGAGGGDVAVAFGHDPDLGAKLSERTGMKLLAVTLDRRGLMKGG